MASTATEAIATICTSTEILNTHLVILTLKQNEGKADHVPSFLGNVQGKLTKAFTTAVSQLNIGQTSQLQDTLATFALTTTTIEQ